MLRLAAKDPSTEGHTRRVATLAVEIGERLGLPESRLRLLALGGLLHDMGKLSVPDHILNKPGALTDEEFAVIKRHPVWGRELLSSSAASRRSCSRSSRAITSASTAAAIPTAPRRSSWSSRCACSPSRTSSTP